ncbi:MAG TPA: TonB-dependent receptor [Bryobacteraceae bacterium]
MAYKVFLFCAAAILPALLSAQSYTASIRGVVSDASQAPLPNAKVTVTDADRNTSQTVTSDNAGRYIFTALPPGHYTLAVEASGFQKYQHSVFELQVQQQATIDMQLNLGTVATSIDVNATAPLLNTTSATLGQVVDNKFILSLPLAGRSPLTLVQLTPGVTPSNLNPGGQSNTNFTANGTRNSTADVLLDGISVANIEQNSGITNLEYQPSVDAVQEFKVQTNYFSAEFGNTGGSVINMITKSGTNDLHGTVYEFHRNSALNANDWFANRAGRSIPDFKRNVFGGTVGGPVRIPHLYNGKDKTFFFYDYEGTRQSSATTRNMTVPTAKEKAGDFSDTRTSSGQLITIYNPFDTYKTAAGKTLRHPFAGNQVPVSMQDPIALNVMKYYPDPTSDGLPFTHVNNFFAQGVNVSQGDQMDVKLDHNISEKTRFTSRYSLNWGASIPPLLLGNIADNSTNGDSSSRTQNFVFDLTRVQSPTTIFEFRYGLLRQRANTNPKSLGFDQTSLGLPDIYLTSGVKMFPTFTAEGYQELGQVGYGLIARGDSMNDVMGNMTKIIGGHTIKAGVEARFLLLNYLQPGYPQGHLSYNRAVTMEDPNSSSSVQGNAIASMLAGWGSGGDYHLDPPSASASKYMGFYVQDDWKIARRLTINLGLRYDFDLPRTERYNRYSWFDFNAPSPIAGKVPGYPDLKGQFRFADDNTRSPVDADFNNIQPRIGFAYELNDKTAIRAGYGIFYTVSRATIKGHTGSGFSTGSTPEWSRDGNLTRYATPENPYPNGLNIPPGNSEGAATFLGLGVGTETRPNQNPQYQQWNFSIQRALPGSSVLQVNYTGGKGTHLYFGGGTENQDRMPLNYWGLGRTALNGLVPNPFYGIITDPKSKLSAQTVTLNSLLRPYPQYTGASGSTPSIGNSIYHGVQVQYEKRFSHGLALLAHYTFAKLIDDSSFSSGNVGWLGGVTDVQDPFNLRLERAVSAMDITHRFVLTGSYELPIGHGKAIGNSWSKPLDILLGGWEVNALMTFSSGFPLNSGSQYRESPLQNGVLWEGTQRPNLNGDPSVEGSVESKLDHYVNAAAFSRPAPDTFGTMPRTISTYRSPGIKNLDAAIFKNFAFTEQRYLQLRLEGFTVTNTPTFATPHLSYGATNFGVIDRYAGGRGPRELQVAAKFYF